MKNFIYLNYNIVVNKIYQKNNCKFFFYNDNKYYIVENINIENIKELIDLTNYLYSKNIGVNTFIVNNTNNYVTSNGKNTICLLRDNNYEKDISIDYIMKFQNIKCNLRDYDILKEWKNEVDTLEKEMIEYNNEYQTIQNSINYFIGMAENAIELLGVYKKHIVTNNDSIGHLINYKRYSNCEFDNPFTFIKTNRMHDLAYYIKYRFLTNSLDYAEIEKISNMVKNEYEIIFLFSNLLYPKIYFDLVKDILLDKEKEDKLNKLIKCIKSYKELLKYVQDIYKNVKEIRLITWLSE